MAAIGRRGPRRARGETYGELSARLNIFERNLAEIEQRTGIVEGNLRNTQSAIDDMRLNDKGLLSEAYHYREVVQQYRDEGFKALVRVFLKEIRDERKRLVLLLQNGEED